MTQQELLRIYSMYLPYGLNINTEFGINVPKQGLIYEVIGISYKSDAAFNNGDKSLFFEMKDYYKREFSNSYFNFKPILRPLSDLTKQIEHKGERINFQEIMPFDFSDLSEFDYDYIPFNLALMLCEYHFDIFGLIEKGLAVNKNEL